MRTRWQMSCAALSVCVFACGGKSVDERIEEHDRVRVSWEQTTRFVGAEWAARAVPDAYAARTLTRAGEELRNENEKLRKDEIPDRDRTRLGDSLSAARVLADSVERAVRASDRNAVMRLVQRTPGTNADSLLRADALR